MIRAKFIFLLIIALVFVPDFVSGQGLSGGGIGGGSNRIEGKVKFLPIPYLNYDRSIGFTIGALPMLMFNPVEKDTISPSSVVGGLGMYTTNDSWFGMVFGSFHFKEDKWRVSTAGGVGNINFQFYLDAPINSWIPYSTEAKFIFAQVQRMIVKNFYGGISFINMDLKTSTDIQSIEEEITLRGLGLVSSIDKRTNIFYPRGGFITNIQYFTYPEIFDNEYVSDKIEIDHNHYFSVRRERDVIAARAFVGLGLGNLSFNQQFVVGKIDIRGYSQGEYRGNYLMALQCEYRWNFHKRLGAVGFFGLATVFESINTDHNGKILPGGGLGFRYTVVEETQFKAGMDIAAGIGDWSIQFRISEAF